MKLRVVDLKEAMSPAMQKEQEITKQSLEKCRILIKDDDDETDSEEAIAVAKSLIKDNFKKPVHIFQTIHVEKQNR